MKSFGEHFLKKERQDGIVLLRRNSVYHPPGSHDTKDKKDQYTEKIVADTVLLRWKSVNISTYRIFASEKSAQKSVQMPKISVKTTKTGVNAWNYHRLQKISSV